MAVAEKDTLSIVHKIVATGMIVVRWIVFETNGKRKGKLAAGVGLSKENVSEGSTLLLSLIPSLKSLAVKTRADDQTNLNHSASILNPRHRHWAACLIYHHCVLVDVEYF